MRIKHKQARDTVIALNVGRFEVDSDGMLRPDPTPEQWARFGGAQCYFAVVVDDTPPAEPSLPVEVPTLDHSSNTPASPEAEPSSTVWSPEGVTPAASAPPASPFAWDDDDDAEDDDGAEDEGDPELPPLSDGTHFLGDVDDLDNAEQESPPRYGEMTYAELKEECKDRGISVARASREELISRLNASDLGV